MPGKHKKGKGKGKKDYLLLSILILIGGWFTPSRSMGFMPHLNSSPELRIIAEGASFSDYKIHGAIIGGEEVLKNVKLSGMLSMSKEDSHLKALAEYQLNDYLRIGLTGGLSQAGKGVGDFIAIGQFPLIKNIVFLPFLSVSHEVVGDVGVVFYFKIKKVSFSAGFSYCPEIRGHQEQKFSLMVGTGLSNRQLQTLRS